MKETKLLNITKKIDKNLEEKGFFLIDFAEYVRPQKLVNGDYSDNFHIIKKKIIKRTENYIIDENNVYYNIASRDIMKFVF